MKHILLLACLCLHGISHGQITFEEITAPVDFSLSVIRQSPTGEYFVQASNDRASMYTSMDGQDWTLTTLPELHTMDDIQFFSDGTPLLKDDSNEHLIRRNGVWQRMRLSGSSGYVQASFIKNDSLFAYQDNSFGYSLDKGQSFTKIFTFGENIIDHQTHLWKFDKYFVLHHTAGATDNLSVFNEVGDRLRMYDLDVSSASFLYSDCEQLLIVDNERYYMLKELALIFTSGPVTNVFPGATRYDEFYAQNDHFYLRKGSDIFRSIDCAFTWEPVASSELVETIDKTWIDAQGDVFLYNTKADYFIEQINGSNQWEEHLIDIDFPFIYDVDESALGHQMALTSNALFNKNLEQPGWKESGEFGGYNGQVHYSPDGDIYVNRTTEILYSADNGTTFSAIYMPAGQLPFTGYTIEVLDNDILFITDEFLGNTFYTLNNGQDWIPTGLSFPLNVPKVKLVDNYIIVADLDYEYIVSRINIPSNIVTSVDLGDFYNLNYYGSVIQEDGTIYFNGMDFNGPNPEGLYRYRIGGGLDYLGQFDQFIHLNTLETSGSDLYAFSPEGYYVFNGETFEEFSYSGIPITNAIDFIISENQYVYAILGWHRLFRSTEPLSHPQYLSGHVYDDDNADCNADGTESPLKHWQVKIQNDSYLRIRTTDSDGKFNFTVPEGEYTLSTQPLSSNWDVCQRSLNVSVHEGDENVQQDFLAFGLRECADLEIDFSTPLLRRCFDNFYSVRIRNSGPEATTGTILTMELDPFFEFTSATIPYTLVNDSILRFDLGVIEVNEEIFFHIFFKLSCDADLGMEHCLMGILEDDVLCNNERSTYRECQENIGSFDPNDKRVFNEAGVETDRIDKGEYIYYHIRFQNTGTDTAFNVRVTDPLSPKLDLSTLEMLSASHGYTYFISDGPALVVLFDDILLADSTINEPASHGFFKFRVKPFPAFDYGTTIPNTADIYFDFNEAVITNEATMFILPPVGTKELDELIEFSVFPNPAKEKLELQIAESYRNRIDTWIIYDSQGKIAIQALYSQDQSLNISSLMPGAYTVMLMSNKKVIGTTTFVKG